MSLANKLTILDVDESLIKDKRVAIRVDFNVPIDAEKQEVVDDRRIVAAIPTIQYVLERKPKYILLMSHLGRPDGRPDPKASLWPVAKCLARRIAKPVTFLDRSDRETANSISRADYGQILLLENVRFRVEEEGSGKDENGNKIKAKPEDVEKFREWISGFCDLYINDAFGTAHRAHSTVVGVKAEPRVAGLLMKKELEFFAKALEKPEAPFVGIIGGSKVSDKILLIENLLDRVNSLIVCGGMAYTFLKVSENVEIGKSIFDAKGVDIVPKILEKAKAKGVAIHLPVDFITADKFAPDAQTGIATTEQGIPADLQGLDIGPQSIKNFTEVILGAKTILWNGPAGVFEFDAFAKGTNALMDAVAEATKKGAVTIIGGGDTASAVSKAGRESAFSHVSTGGGASLELLEGKVLPGVAILSERA